MKAETEFTFSLTHFFLHTKVALTDRRIAWKRPNTILGLIPAGSHDVSFPLNQVSAVSTNSSLGVWKLIIGGILSLVGIFNLGSFFGWVVLVVGVVIFVNAFKVVLAIATAGQATRLQISPTNRSSAQSFAKKVNTALAERLSR